MDKSYFHPDHILTNVVKYLHVLILTPGRLGNDLLDLANQHCEHEHPKQPGKQHEHDLLVVLGVHLWVRPNEEEVLNVAGTLQAPAGAAAPEAAARVARAARAGASLLEELGRRRATHNPSFAEMLAAHLRVDPWGSRVAAPPPDPDDFYDALAQEVEAHAARVRRGEILAPGLEEPLPTVGFTPAAPASADPRLEAAAAAAARISARVAGARGGGRADGDR